MNVFRKFVMRLFLLQELTNPTDKRIYAVAAALYKSEEYSVAKLAEMTKIDPWFLSKINNIVNMIKTLEKVDYKVIKDDL